MNTHSESRVEFVVRRLKEVSRKNWPEVSRVTGVPEKTICKIAYRETKDPRSSTLEPLHTYLEIAPQRRKDDS